MAIDDSGEWWVGSEPSDIKEYLAGLTRSDGYYPTTEFRMVRCACGAERFKLERASEVTQRTCGSCGNSSLICREATDWEEAAEDEEPEAYACVECDSHEANIGVGFAHYEGQPDIDGVKWFYVGVRCAACGILGCFNDGKIGYGPAVNVYESV